MGPPAEPEDVGWWIDVTAREAGRDRLPVTWVALDEQGEALGAVGIDEFDIEERQDRSPWLIGMIVRSDRRGAGVGGKLIAELEAWATTQGYDRLWVATGQAANFYQKYGWEPIETLKHALGKTTQVMTVLTKTL